MAGLEEREGRRVDGGREDAEGVVADEGAEGGDVALGVGGAEVHGGMRCRTGVWLLGKQVLGRDDGGVAVILISRCRSRQLRESTGGFVDVGIPPATFGCSFRKREPRSAS